MKKLFSLLLAAATAFSLGTTAFAATMGGVVVPNKGDGNTVTFASGDHTYAKLSFQSDSEADRFYAGLSTDWDDCAYGSDFYDLDAYFYSFTINPSIPATSVPTLLLYNRFTGEDGELTVDPGDVTIYRVKENGLEDVTSSFTATETSDGDPVFAARTRSPGAYILSAQEAPEAVPGVLSPKRVVEAGRKESSAPKKAASGTPQDTCLILPSFAKE